MDKKTVTWIVIAALVIALIIGLYFVVKAMEPKLPVISTTTPGTTPAPTTGIVDILGTLFEGIKNLFGPKSPEVVQCDPSRPGYEKDGTPNPNCGKDYTGCELGKCDPNRSGYDECGFPTINC